MVCIGFLNFIPMETTKIALVTGANRGIGFAVAKELLKNNCTVIVISRTEKDGKEAVNKLSEFGNAVYYQLDVTSKESIDNCFAFAKADYRRFPIPAHRQYYTNGCPRLLQGSSFPEM